MNEVALGALRKAAALAFAVPGLEVDVCHDNALVARVERRFGGRSVPLATTLLSPCAFRSSVAHATAHTRRGGKALFLGLDPGAELSLRYTMPFSGAARPLDLIVSRVGETVVHVFATPVDSQWVRAAAHACVCDPGDAINAAHDPALDITLVYCETRATELSARRPAVESMMETLLVRCAVEEITGHVALRSGQARG